MLAAHPPAVKVGGRRLSLSKHKHTHPESTTTPIVSPGVHQEPDSEAVDYPRPQAAPAKSSDEGDSNEVDANKETPKRERKQSHTNQDKDKKFQENAMKRHVGNDPVSGANPKRDLYGASGRIGQPAAKGLV